MPDSKPELRRRALRARRALSDAEREFASDRICDAIIRSAEFMSAGTIACYLPTLDEVDPTFVIERAWRVGKRVFAPVVGAHDRMLFAELAPDSLLTRNRFGIWEPAPDHCIRACELDLVITPLVAFDANRNRVGMGGGYFDRCFRFLKNRRKWLRPKLIGVSFKCQEVAEITPDSWDIPLYKVVTESD